MKHGVYVWFSRVMWNCQESKEESKDSKEEEKKEEEEDDDGLGLLGFS